MTAADSTRSQPWFQTDFAPAEFAARREKVFEAIGKQAIAVLQGAEATGAFDIFRQTNEFYYLCGVEVPHANLMLDGRSHRTTLYLPPHDARHERSEGPSLNADDAATAVRLTGVDDVRPLRALGADAAGARCIFTPRSPGEKRQACRDTLRYARTQIDSDPWDALPSREQRFADRLVSLAPGAEIVDLSPTLDRLRTVKSPREIELMRRAGRLTARAVLEAMRATRPGVMEFELGAAADYIYTLGGARGGGYRPIIAGGRNIWNAHYYRNNCRLEAGELVLMDYAPDYNYYTSDIGRMWPVDGRYSDVQRELYGYIIEYHKLLLTLIRPGITAAQVMDEAAARMHDRVERGSWSKPAYQEAARGTLAFRGHLSHGVGMAVHDVGDYQAEVLRPGVVFALDPQMWVPAEQLYIRVEDTVAVTENGCEVLTPGAPIELDDVEREIGRPGLFEVLPPAEIETLFRM
ncbi:MAG TPA: Xaa-Pro peptidase family protein [Planctomycetaceae bacterium]|nr:Xaa-Pro peptidase family protein [Planctomycetaceae bacterium]